MECIEEAVETISTDLCDLLDAEVGATVTLVAGDTHLVVHRAVLTARSPVFADKLHIDMLEANSDQLVVPDMEGPVLRQLLTYLYTLRAPQLHRMAPQMLATADKYRLSILKEQCEQQVTAQLAMGTAAAAAVLAIKHSCNSLRQAAINFIKAHTHQVMATQGWADAVRTQPEEVVEVSRLVSEPSGGTTRSYVSESSPMGPIEEVKETTSTDLGNLLDAVEGATVTLVAGDTHLVAHRAVLAARSPVFAARFHDEVLKASSGQLAITDVEGPVVRQMLAYLYTLQAPQLPGMASQLLAAADKYGLSGLKAECEQQVTAQLAVEIAAAATDLVVRQSFSHIRQAKVNFVEANTCQVMATQGCTDAVHIQPEEAVEVSQLLSEPPTENSTPGTAGSGPSATTLPHREHSRTAPSAAPPTTARHTLPTEDAAVSHPRGLSALEKAGRLIEAAKLGAVEELKTLLAAGLNINARDRDRTTALHYAADRGHLEAVRCLLAAGAEVDASNKWGNTPLHRAAIGGHASVVQRLVASSADPNARNEDGWTPLHSAALNGHSEAVIALLEAGADREARTNGGKTPLDLATENNGLQVIDMLR